MMVNLEMKPTEDELISIWLINDLVQRDNMRVRPFRQQSQTFNLDLSAVVAR